MKKEKKIGIKISKKKNSGTGYSYYARITYNQGVTNVLVPIYSAKDFDNYIEIFKRDIIKTVRYFEATEPDFAIKGIKDRYDQLSISPTSHYFEESEVVEESLGDILSYNQYMEIEDLAFLYDDSIKYNEFTAYLFAYWARHKFVEDVFDKLNKDAKMMLVSGCLLLDYCKENDTILEWLTNKEYVNQFTVFINSKFEETCKTIGFNSNKIDISSSEISYYFMNNFYKFNFSSKNYKPLFPVNMGVVDKKVPK